MKKHIYLFFFFLLSLGGFAQSYEGTDFWFSYTPNSTEGAEHVLQIHFVSKVATTAHVEIPLGGAPITASIPVPAKTMVTYTIPNRGRARATNSEVVTKRGVHVTMDDPGIVYAGNYKPYSSDASIVIPTNALGSEYQVVAYGFTEVGTSQFVITAAEDNTQLQITYNGGTDKGRTVGDVQNVTLNQGETFFVKATGSVLEPDKDLTGTEVISTNNKKFSIYSGNACVYVGGCPACDHLFEQMRPLSTWGTEHIFSALQKPSVTPDVVRIYASANGTQVALNGAPVATLNKGQHVDVDLTGSAIITGTNPIHVSQYLRGSTCSAPPLAVDPLFMDILPTAQFSPFYIFGTSTFTRYSSHQATVVMETAETTSLLLDGAPIAPTWNPIPGTAYSYAYINLARGISYTIESSTLSGFGLYVYGHGPEESYGYTAGGNLLALNGCPSPNFLADDVCFGTDVEFSDLSVDPQWDIDQWTWDFGDGSAPTVINGAGSVSDTRHAYPAPGVYNVTLTVRNNKTDGPCTEVISKDIEVFENPLAEAGSDAAICEGDSVFLNGSATLGATPYTFQWSGTSFDDPINPVTFAVPNSNGKWFLDVKDANDCVHRDSIEVSVDAKPNVALDNLNDICLGDSLFLSVSYDGTDSIWVTIENTLSYFEELREVHNGVFPKIGPTAATQYWISSAEKKEGNPNCISISPDSVSIDVKPLPTATWSGLPTICEGEDASISIDAQGGVAPWTLNYTENGTSKSVTINTSPAQLDFTNLSDSTFLELVSIQYNGTPACENPLTGATQINVNKEVNSGEPTSVEVCKSLTEYNLFENLDGNPDEGGTWTTTDQGVALTGNLISPNLMNGGTYVLVYTVKGDAPCPDSYTEMTVTITTAPIIAGIQEVCTAAGDEYYVTGIITGGDPNTYSTTSGSITFDGTNYIFESDLYPSETPYSITISDGFGCGIIELEGSKKCNCLTSAGTMVTDSTLQICVNQDLDATDLYNNDFNDDGNDAVVFFLHDGSGNALGNIIDFNPNAPVFTYPSGIDISKTYYISAGAANTSGGTYGIDLDDECLDVAQGTPVNIFPLPSAAIGNDTTICENLSPQIPLTFTGFQPFTLVTNDGDSLGGFSAEDILDLNLSNDSSFHFVEVIDNYCSNSMDHTANVDVVIAPKAVISGGNVYCENSGDPNLVEVTIEGDGTSYSLTYHIINGSIDSTFNIGNLTNGNQALSPIDGIVVGSNVITLDRIVDNTGLTCPADLSGMAEVIVNALPDVSLAISPLEICYGDTVWITPTIQPNDAIVNIDFSNLTSAENETFSNISNGQKIPYIPATGTFDLQGQLATNVATNCSLPITDNAETVVVNPAPIGRIFSNIQVCEDGDSNRVSVEIEGVAPYSLNLSRNGIDLFADPQVVTGSTFDFAEMQIPGLYHYDISFLSDNSSGSCLGTAMRVDSVLVAPLPTASFDQNLIELCIGSNLNFGATLTGSGQVTAQVREVGSGDTFTLIGTEGTPVSHLMNNVQDSLVFVFDDIYDNSNTVVCHNTSTDTLRVYVNPLPEVTGQISSGLETICFGDPLKLELNSPNYQSATVYLTEMQTATQLTTTITNGIGNIDISTYNQPLDIPVRIDSIVSNQGASCSNVQDDLITGFARAIPTATMDYDADYVCAGSSANLVLQANGTTPISMSFIQNTDVNNYVFNPGETITLEVTPDISTTGRVDYVEYTTAPACRNDYGNTLSDELEVMPLPIVSFRDDSARICIGDLFDIVLEIESNTTVTIDITNNLDFTSTLNTNSAVEVIEVAPTNEGFNDYFITGIVDSYGCVAAELDTLTINALPAPTVDFAAIETESCPPLNTTFVNNSVGSFAACTWNFGDGNQVSGSCDGLNHAYPFTGNYTVSLSLTTDEGCVSEITKENYITVFPQPEADFSFGPAKPTLRNTTVDFTNRSKNADTFQWRFDELGHSDLENPFFQFPFDEPGLYDVELVASNVHGCIDTLVRKLKVEGILNVNIPNTFTPDGDGINDIFIPIIEGYDEEANDYYFGVFDRWGVPVFQTRNIEEGWNGFDSRGVLLKIDSYVYIVEVRSKYTAEKERFTGDVSLIR